MTSPPRSPRTRLWLGAIVAVLALAVVVVIARPTVRQLRMGDLSVEYPASWVVHDHLPPSTGMGSTWAIIGTMPWGPCDAMDINCHYRQRLDPGEIEVEIGMRGLLPDGICTWANHRPDLVPRSDGIVVNDTAYFRYLTRPSARTDWVVNGADYYKSDGWRELLIAFPDSTTEAYTVSAKWRGPGNAGLIAALDRLIATLQFPRSSHASGVPDCGAPFPPM